MTRHHLDVVVEGQLVAAHDVDVGLRELAVAALLRPLAAPGGLDLEAPERELQVAGVLQDVAREGHGEVEVEAELGLRVGLGGDALEDVDLLVDLTALGQPVDRLDDPGLDVGEAVQLEGARDRGDDLALDDALRRQQLGEPAQRGDLAHRRSWGRSWGRSRLELGGRGWWRARDRWRSARRGRAAPRCRRRAAAPCRPGCAASWRGRRRAGRCGRWTRRRGGRRRTSAPRRPARAYGVRKVTEPSVWPGVWSTTNRSPASSSSARSDSSRTSSGSAHE